MVRLVSNKQKGLVFSPSDKCGPAPMMCPPMRSSKLCITLASRGILGQTCATLSTGLLRAGLPIMVPLSVYTPLTLHWYIYINVENTDMYMYIMYRYYISNIYIYCIMYIDMYIYMCVHLSKSSKPHCCSISTATPPFGDNTWGSQTN